MEEGALRLYDVYCVYIEGLYSVIAVWYCALSYLDLSSGMLNNANKLFE